MDISCEILSGKDPAARIKKIVSFDARNGFKKPKLAVIMVSDNPASCTYVKGKERDCKECGIDFELFHLEEQASQEKIENLIEQLNFDMRTTGILVQLPLPKHLNKDMVIKTISPSKDVDCFTDINLGKLFLNRPMFEPCTPSGIIDLMSFYGIDVVGKHCVIIGRSDIVGKPLATMFINYGATVTVCNSHTQDLKSITQSADIIVCAVGKPKFLTADMIREGAIVIDVGINKGEDGKLCGDVDFDDVKNKAGAITPVPGGVGLMTRAALMKNIIKATYGS